MRGGGPRACAASLLTEAGPRLTAHAGEADGWQSVDEAVRLLGVQRIGHGVHMIDDAQLTQLVVRTGEGG